MPAQAPIITQIRQNLIRLIGTARTINGAQVDVTAEGADDQGNTFAPYKVVVGDGPLTDVSNDKGVTPLGHDGYWKQFDLYLLAQPSEADVGTPDDLLDALEMTVRGTIGKGRNYTLGNLVRDYAFDPTMPAGFGQGQLPCRILPFKVQFLTLKGNPYQQ